MLQISSGQIGVSAGFKHVYRYFPIPNGIVIVNGSPGLDDAVPGGGDMGTGWNVGTAGD